MSDTIMTMEPKSAAQSPTPELMEKLVDQYTDNLMRAAFSMGFPESEAEELVQATFCAFLDGGARFQKRSQLLTYLFGILYNKGREVRRRSNRHDSIDAAVDERFSGNFGPLGDDWEPDGHWNMKNIDYFTEVEKHAESANLSSLLQECLDGLSDTMRMAFTMKEVEGFEPADICKALDLTVSNLGVTLFRARNKLRDCLIGKGAVIH